MKPLTKLISALISKCFVLQIFLWQHTWSHITHGAVLTWTLCLTTLGRYSSFKKIIFSSFSMQIYAAGAQHSRQIFYSKEGTCGISIKFLLSFDLLCPCMCQHMDRQTDTQIPSQQHNVPRWMYCTVVERHNKIHDSNWKEAEHVKMRLNPGLFSDSQGKFPYMGLLVHNMWRHTASGHCNPLNLGMSLFTECSVSTQSTRFIPVERHYSWNDRKKKRKKKGSDCNTSIQWGVMG